MKKFTMPLLSVIFVTLIAGSVQSIAADHLEPGQGIFVDDAEVNLATTEDSNYQVYLQMVLRNGDEQLINVTESTANGAYVPHMISDHVFDTLMSEKEIVTVDGIKYEKVQWIDTTSSCEVETCQDIHQNVGAWNINFYGDFNKFGFLNIPLFQAMTSNVILEDEDNIVNQWTVLREAGE